MVGKGNHNNKVLRKEGPRKARGLASRPTHLLELLLSSAVQYGRGVFISFTIDSIEVEPPSRVFQHFIYDLVFKRRVGCQKNTAKKRITPYT